MALKKELPQFDLSQLSYSEKLELLKELEMKEGQLKKYRISSFKPISDSQEQVIQAVHNAVEWRTPTKIIWANGWNSGWKCKRLKEPVLMHDWTWKEAHNLKVWDLLMWPDSKPRTVTSVYYGKSEMFKLLPESGEPVIVNWNHQLMLVHRRRDRKWNRPKLQKEYQHLQSVVPEWKLVQMSVTEYLKQSTKWKAEAYMWRPKIIHFTKKEQLIDPYMLGVWLWDGTTIKPQITNTDKEVIDYIYEYANKNSMKVTKYKLSYSLVRNYSKWCTFTQQLRDCWVLWDKHIPLNYKTGDEQQRLELLAGLLDTDWEFTKWKTPRYSITQKSKKLAYDILDLARSLGFRCNITETVKTCTNHTRADYKPWTYYRVSVNGDVWRIPCKVQRKKAEEKVRRHNKDWLVSKFFVESIWEDFYVWFTLDDDKLYLDRNYIVHHNSAISSFCVASVALWELTKEIWARYIWERKRIAIFVENFAGVRKLEEYMFEEPTFRVGSWHTGLARIPPEYISNIEYSQTKPKAIRYVKLTNWTTIEFNTYNQGYNSAAGGNYDFIWMDEPPQDENVFNEIIARLSRSHCILLFSATLTNDRMDYIDDFFANMDEEQKEQVEVITLLSKDNKHTDTTILRALWEHRLTGRKPEKKWKVFYQFYKWKHVVEHFEPTYENMWGYCKYYMWIDPGGSHPFAIILFCIDEEWMIYIFKEYLLRDAEQAYSNVISIIEENYNKYPFEKIIVDMRDAYFIKTLKQDAQLRNVQKCDKHTKWPRWENNIVWRRMRINEYFAQWKIMISNKCSELIQEFDRLKYKKNASENATAKSDIDWEDDGIDAFGYAFDYATKNIGMSKLIINNRYQRPQIETKKNNITPTNNSWNDRKLHSLNIII